MNRFYLLGIFLLLISACDDEDDVQPEPGRLELGISNLADLGESAQYEGWIIVNGTPESTGTFTVDANGDLSETTFEVDHEMLDDATAFVLSIEPIPDNDPAPSAIKLLGGDFTGTSAAVNVNHPAALNSDFSAAAGSYLLATPTTPEMDDELSGVWFIDVSSGSPEASLSLPALPSGWVYEGWAVIDDMPISTGTFTAVDVSDNASPYSGSQPGPPFPGEDFVMNAPSGLTFPTQLTGSPMVISIEPSPDNEAAPFQLKPLVAMTPADAMAMQSISLDNMVTSTFPAGTVTR